MLHTSKRSSLKWSLLSVATALLLCLGSAMRATAGPHKHHEHHEHHHHHPHEQNVYVVSPYGNPAGMGADPAPAEDGSAGALEGAAGDLEGAASVIDAVGNYQVQAEKARLLQQKVERSRVKTRRTILEEWQYERANTPTVEDMAEETQAQEVRRVLHNPGLPEVLSGYALNTLLRDLYAQQSSAEGPETPLGQQLLKQVNVTVPGGGSAGALKGVSDGGTLSWPLPLRRAGQEETRRLDQGVADALSGISDNGSIDPDTFDDLLRDVSELRSKLRSHSEYTPSEDVEARRFLNQLEEGLRALGHPDAVSRLRGRVVAEGRTVPEMVRFMAGSGLVFAPAAPGQEAAYVALYNSLAEYRNALQEPDGDE